MKNMFKSGGPTPQFMTGQDDTSGASGDTTVSVQNGPKEQAPWTGVSRGRDGLLGRIDASLGSII